MKLYLAGPDVFRRDHEAHGQRLKRLCERHGAIGLWPMDNAMPPGPGDLPWRIRHANMAMIRRCDAIVANMVPFRGVAMDVGTAYEMGVAAALKKIVVGYGDVDRDYHHRVVDAQDGRGDSIFGVVQESDGVYRDRLGDLVEWFAGTPLVENLMVARGVDAQCHTVEQAIAEAVRLVRRKQDGALVRRKQDGGLVRRKRDGA